MTTFYNLLLLCLFPVALYCVVLAMLNRRLQPTLVPGAWDFLGLLFAASGLLLFATPRLLNEMFARALGNIILEEHDPARTASGNFLTLWWIAWTAYYGIVLGGSAVLIWLRSNRTIIYNIGPPDLERALALALGRLRLAVTRAANRLYIASGGAAAPEPVPEPQLTAVSANPLDAVPEQTALPARVATGEAVLDVEAFETMWNVTLHWRTQSGGLRQEVEDALARELREVRTYDNPVGSWFLGVAGFLFALIFMILMVLILGPFLQPHG